MLWSWWPQSDDTCLAKSLSVLIYKAYDTKCMQMHVSYPVFKMFGPCVGHIRPKSIDSAWIISEFCVLDVNTCVPVFMCQWCLSAVRFCQNLSFCSSVVLNKSSYANTHTHTHLLVGVNPCVTPAAFLTRVGPRAATPPLFVTIEALVFSKDSLPPLVRRQALSLGLKGQKEMRAREGTF